jgi:ankyrin repeat protein
MTVSAELHDAFLTAACEPTDANHGQGGLEQAEALLAAHPELASASIHSAAALADDAAVARFIAADPASATASGGPHGWNALTHLCFSRYLRLDPARGEGFVRAAQALLDAGADPNSGWYEQNHQPNPQFESVLYGAAGIAHHPGLTRLLLERGADPNDGEVPYHAAEWFDNRAMQVLVESGKLTADSLTTLLVRKLDWTDLDAVEWLLERGADPNRVSHWGGNALHHALGRDNPLRFFEVLLRHGADPAIPARDGRTAHALAAALGRGDVLELFERHGHAPALEGDDAFLAACARGDADAAHALLARDPEAVARLRAARPEVVAHFAGAGNTAGLELLLDSGFTLDSHASLVQARGESPLHLAVWRARLGTVEALLARSAPLEETNRRGETPLAVAVRAQTEASEWTPHVSTEIVEALLRAGASPAGVPLPTGSAATDALLRQYG